MTVDTWILHHRNNGLEDFSNILYGRGLRTSDGGNCYIPGLESDASHIGQADQKTSGQCKDKTDSAFIVLLVR
jgi:hypothetical protein